MGLAAPAGRHLKTRKSLMAAVVMMNIPKFCFLFSFWKTTIAIGNKNTWEMALQERAKKGAAPLVWQTTAHKHKSFALLVSVRGWPVSRGCFRMPNLRQEIMH